MRNIILLLIILTYSFQVKSQLIVSQTGTITQWVQNNLVGTGITVSNVTYTGSTQSIGTFTSGLYTGNMGITSGLVISTGNVTQLPGYGSAFCSSNTNGGSDPLLAQLITQSINDAAVLEFDFVPVSDSLKFQYVFGSEEYPEFVNSINDVFGFFVSGLNPYGGTYSNVNVALIPNTTIPITINNVNQNVNSAYYVNNASGTYVKLDGFTTVLTASLKVIPCVTYHIKIAIGDAQDHIYDSGVFFKANSFMSNAIIIDKSTTSLIDTTAVEGCNDAIITFRIPQPKSTATYVNFYAGGTATNGVDYTQLPNSVIIPAGQDSINMIIHPFLDNLSEPTEYLDLIVSTSVCTYDTVSIAIKDNSPPISSMADDTIICGNTLVNITSSVTGGYSPYSYIWSTGDTTASIVVDPFVTTTYTLMVSDLCMNDSIDSTVVIVSEPIYQIHDTAICFGDTGTIFIADNMSNTYSWLFNGSTSNSINVSPNSTAYYQFTTTDTLGCSITDTAVAVVNPLPIYILSNDTVICAGGSATLKAFGAFTYEWINGVVNNTNIVSPLSDTFYSVVATDDNSCKYEDSILVNVLAVPIAIIESAIDTICIGNTITLTANGGNEYLWNTSSSFQDINVTPLKSTTYTVTVSNSLASTICSSKTSYTLNVKKCNFFYYPTAFTPNGDGLNDNFGVIGEFGAVDSYKIYIYNRWGELVFYSANPSEKWHGIYNGINAPSDVYTYIVYVKEKFFDPFQLKGTIHLIR